MAGGADNEQECLGEQEGGQGGLQSIGHEFTVNIIFLRLRTGGEKINKRLL